MTTGNPHFSDVYLDRIEKLKAKDLQAAAKKYFDPQASCSRRRRNSSPTDLPSVAVMHRRSRTSCARPLHNSRSCPETGRGASDVQRPAVMFWTMARCAAGQAHSARRHCVAVQMPMLTGGANRRRMPQPTAMGNLALPTCSRAEPRPATRRRADRRILRFNRR